MSKTYVIIRSSGEYEDYRTDTVCACATEKDAQVLAERMGVAAERVIAKLKTLMDKCNAVEPEDVRDNCPEWDEAWMKYQSEENKKGTRLDRAWKREAEEPHYYVETLAVRKLTTLNATKLEEKL